MGVAFRWEAFRYDLRMTLSDPCSMIPRDRLGNLLFREYLVYPEAAFQLFCPDITRHTKSLSLGVGNWTDPKRLTSAVMDGNV